MQLAVIVLRTLTTALLLSPVVSLLPIPDSLLHAQTEQSFKVEADRLLQKGQELIDKNQYPAALEALQQSLSLYRKIADQVGEGDALYSLGDIYYYQSQYSQALEFYQQSLVLRQATGDRKTIPTPN